MRTDTPHIARKPRTILSMGKTIYVVTATFPDDSVRREYLHWLKEGHVDRVVQGGAQCGEVIEILEPAAPFSVQTRYVFADRAAYDRYVRDHAPALRAEGMERFGPARGVNFSRMVGVIR